MTSSRWAALVRGVNVGGRNALAMGDLRQVMADLGHRDVETYLQSGNVVFAPSGGGDPSSAAATAAGIERQLADRVGIDVKVVVRTHAELAGIVAANPFPGAAAQPTTLHVAFLSAAADPERLATVVAEDYEPDRFHGLGPTVYLWYPNGSGRSKLTGGLLERRLGVVATARNWNTVVKLLQLTAPADD
ncbi:MAG: DUF1697 domain-containing protein [Acidimicrobiales bacterium]